MKAASNPSAPPAKTPESKPARDLLQKGLESARLLRGFLDENDTGKDIIENEAVAARRYRSLQRRVTIQSFVILGLLLALIVLIPVLQPIYQYEAITEKKETQPLISLSMPNLTDKAVLSWAATSITEILTFGFGDFDQRTISHRDLFTDEGWDVFTQAIREQNMRETVKASQLVLTSVPANLPVIVGKGEDKDQQFQWIVEMPIVMTYTTNNNVTKREKHIVRLTIVRVPPAQNVAGIGIKGWLLF